MTAMYTKQYLKIIFRASNQLSLRFMSVKFIDYLVFVQAFQPLLKVCIGKLSKLLFINFTICR